MNHMAQQYAHTADCALLDCLVLDCRTKAAFLSTLADEEPGILRYEEIQAGIRMTLRELAWLSRRIEEVCDQKNAQERSAERRQVQGPITDKLSGEETELLSLYRQSDSLRSSHILDYARVCADATQAGQDSAGPTECER